MAKPAAISDKKLLAKKLLKATLLLSLFSFSGLILSSSSQPYEAVKTELIAGNSEPVKRTAFLTLRDFSPITKVSACIAPFKTGLISLVHDHIFKTKFDLASKKALSITPPNRRFIRRPLLLSSGEEIPNLFIG